MDSSAMVATVAAATVSAVMKCSNGGRGKNGRCTGGGNSSRGSSIKRGRRNNKVGIE